MCQILGYIKKNMSIINNNIEGHGLLKNIVYTLTRQCHKKFVPDRHTLWSRGQKVVSLLVCPSVTEVWFLKLIHKK
jgi:hypothetical protein